MYKENIKKIIENFKKDLKALVISYIILVVVLKIAFFKESFFSVFRIGLSLYWLFILPGLFIYYLYFKDKDIVKKLSLSFALGASTIGLLSYYLGLLGMHVKIMSLALPLLVAGIALLVSIFSKKIAHSQQ